MPKTLPETGTPAEVETRPPEVQPPAIRTPIVRWMTWLIGLAILAVGAALVVDALSQDTTTPGEIDPHDSPEILRTAVPVPAADITTSPFAEVSEYGSPEALRVDPPAVTESDPRTNPEIRTPFSPIDRFVSPEARSPAPLVTVDPHESPEVLRTEP